MIGMKRLRGEHLRRMAIFTAHDRAGLHFNRERAGNLFAQL